MLTICIQLTWQQGSASPVGDNISTSMAFGTEVLFFLGFLVGERDDTIASQVDPDANISLTPWKRKFTNKFTTKVTTL